MNEGLLWFDSDSRRKLTDKIHQAANRYQTKFGHQPTVCYLNTADFEGPTEINGIQLRAAANVLRHHLWLGIENEAKMAKAA
jgi:hypothetical protein